MKGDKIIMNLSYPAIIHHEDDSYWIEFPDLEGCHTFADTLEDIFDEAKEALSAYCSALTDEGKILPMPSDISLVERENSDDILAIIEVPSLKQRSIKKTLTIPSWLNTAAEKQHINFSQVLQDALIKRLNMSN